MKIEHETTHTFTWYPDDEGVNARGENTLIVGVGEEAATIMYAGVEICLNDVEVDVLLAMLRKVKTVLT